MLFKDSKKIAEYANLLASGVNFIAIQSTLEVVEEQYLVPVIGQQLYDSLNTAFSNAGYEDQLSANQKGLLHQCRRVIGPFLCFEYAPKADVQLSDSGMRRNETTTSKTAYQEQRADFREANFSEGERAIERLLQYLEANTLIHPEWASSTAFEQYNSLLIKTGSSFAELVPTASPYRNYQAMRSKMVDVEEQIADTIYPGLFDHIKAQQNLNPIESKLLFLLKKAIAYQTVGLSIPFLNVRIDANGLTIMGNATAKSDDAAKRVAATDTAVSSYQRNIMTSANYYINKIQKHIKENAATYAAFAPPAVVAAPELSNADFPGAFGLF